VKEKDMVFSSLIFIYLFLPACLLLYIPVKHDGWRNGVLIVFSLVFYAWGEPVYILLMLVSVLVNYWIAVLIDTSRRSGGLREGTLGREPNRKSDKTRRQGDADARRSRSGRRLNKKSASMRQRTSATEAKARYGRSRRLDKAQFCLILAICINLGVLCVCKYSGFFAES
jgi:hypothetical protein